MSRASAPGPSARGKRVAEQALARVRDQRRPSVPSQLHPNVAGKDLARGQLRALRDQSVAKQQPIQALEAAFVTKGVANVASADPTGLGTARRENPMAFLGDLGRFGLTPISGLGDNNGGQGQVGDTGQSCLGVNGIRSFTCSGAVANFIEQYLSLSLVNDITNIDVTGLAPFDRELGCHIIPLSDTDEKCSGLKQGAINVPDGNVLIITSAVFFAYVPVVGMPGQVDIISPSALAGFVTFGMLRQNGSQAFSQETVLGGASCSGGSFLNQNVSEGFASQNVASVQNSVTAVYYVNRQPMIGFPLGVGAHVQGHIVPEPLLREALEKCQFTSDSGAP